MRLVLCCAIVCCVHGLCACTASLHLTHATPQYENAGFVSRLFKTGKVVALQDLEAELDVIVKELEQLLNIRSIELAHNSYGDMMGKLEAISTRLEEVGGYVPRLLFCRRVVVLVP